MADWIDVIVWGIGFALLHEGVSRAARKYHERNAKIAICAGLLVLFGGAGTWYQSAQALMRLTDTQQVPTLGIQSNRDRTSIDGIPVPQRREVSIKLAKIAFANGEEDVKVISEAGQWIPFEPEVEDLQARHLHLKMLAEIKQRRHDLLSSAMAAEREFIRWMLSILVAIFTGWAGGFVLRETRAK